MQVTLAEEIQARVRRQAKAHGISISEYVRRAIERDLGSERPKADISEILGLDDGGEPTDIAKDKKRL